MNSNRRFFHLRSRTFTHWPIFLIILIAFGLRVWALDAIPPGLTHDEAAHLHDARRIWEGHRPIYLTSAYGREPLYDYAAAPLVGLAGLHVVTGRLVSALWGTALVALLYAWIDRALDRPTAMLAAALVALSFWPLSTSRQILRSVAMPTLLTAAIWLFWQAVYPLHPDATAATSRPGRRRYFVSAGALLGLCCYAYMPARITWLVPALFGLSLILADRRRWRRARSGLGLMLLTMALVGAPLFLYLAAHPELEVRVNELAAPLQELRSGDPSPLWARIRETILLFSHRGDVHWMYNVSGWPLLPPVVAALFYLGLLIVAYELPHPRGRAHRLLMLWLVLGVVPALVTGLESSALRAIAAQPAVFAIAALPPIALGRRLWPRLNRLGRTGVVGLALAGLTLLGARTIRDYFNVWGTHRATRVAYNVHVVEIARYLKARPMDTPVTISTLYPGPLHNPYITDVILNPPDRKMRWYDARFALVFPDAEQARAVFPALTPLDAALQPWFEPTARLIDRVELEPDDLSPWFEVYAWQPRVARAALPLTDPVDVGHIVAFVGYQLNAPVIAPGGTVELITCWRVLDVPVFADSSAGSAGDEEWVLFTHVLDSAGQIAGQQDRLDVPAWSWSVGDVFVQLHRFSLDADLEPGLYPIEIGFFTRAEGLPRLPVYDAENASPAGDHILLPPIEVVAP